LNGLLRSLPALDLEQIRAEQARRVAEAERAEFLRNIEQIRKRCVRLSGFVREAWQVLEPNSVYIHGWHIDAICEHLEAVTYGRISRLLINIPPGTMKSLIVSVFWPAWEWGPAGMPWMRYLTTSYSENYVKRDSRRMRDLVQSDWYQDLWGKEVELTRVAEMSFANTATGFREGVPFASLTGGRGHRVIIDDPHSTETAESEAERNRTTRIFRESVPSRLVDPRTSAIVVIMQRLHAEDVSGQILSLKLGYEHLMLPMEFEPERRCSTSIGFRDPRTYDGELLFPERFPREVVERDKIPMGSIAVAGQFQQRPTPREGGLFKRHWFDFVAVVPALPLIRCRGWDLAASKVKQGRQPDWTAGVLLAWASGVFYVENCARMRGSAAEVEKLIKHTAQQDGQLTRIRLPQDPGQAGKSQAGSYVKLLAGYTVIVKPVTGSKETRASPAAAQAEAGNVKIVRTGNPARDAWIEPFLDEVCLFPGGTFDDQVDGFADALNELALGSTYTLANV
jgi:predicted phage terminase large subunit-like protein